MIISNLSFFSRHVLIAPASPFLIVNDLVSYFMQNIPLPYPPIYFFIFLHTSYIEYPSSFQKPIPNLWIPSTPAFSRTIHCHLYFFHFIYPVILSQMNPSHWNLNMFKSHQWKKQKTPLSSHFYSSHHFISLSCPVDKTSIFYLYFLISCSFILHANMVFSLCHFTKTTLMKVTNDF